ncbi:unnamed protein product [Peronospora farinosa]|uniref:RxLR effector protein n=1 Tax=Peronospora farinosa TaxID=134698 RepID=A0AAV0URA4_9STRA|nr:unnamed protein product [Peronospora farinosa]CAI5739002.1 unnamed protein product [Peronospora farinosa]
MRLSKFLLPVTLISIAYCSTFTSAENVIQVKSSTTDSQRELMDVSHRNLRGGVAEDGVKPEEEDEDEERKGGRGVGRVGGGLYGGGGSMMFVPRMYPYRENRRSESLDDYFKKNGYSVKDIEHFKKLVRELPLTKKQKRIIMIAFAKMIKSQQLKATR